MNSGARPVRTVTLPFLYRYFRGSCRYFTVSFFLLICTINLDTHRTHVVLHPKMMNSGARPVRTVTLPFRYRYFTGSCRYFAVSFLFFCVFLFIISFDGSHLNGNCHWVIRPHG